MKLFEKLHNVYMYFSMSKEIVNNVVSHFRDMCLETVARFNDDPHKCFFNTSTAGYILQKCRLFTMIFVIVA